MLNVGAVTGLATQLLGRTDLGSPHGVTDQDHWVRQLWHITYIFAIPIGAIVLGGIIWCVLRYRVKPGSQRRAAQFQYHIPIEAAYTIIPLVIVAIVFGFMYNAENKVNAISKTPAVKITVEAFQWGWRFTYPNGHQQYGAVSDELDINNYNNLPVLYVPSNETVQIHLISDDVVHTFYVKDLLFQRDMIPGIDNTFDINLTKTAQMYGQCNNICGQFHAYMRFLMQSLSPADYDKWYAQQPPCSITTAGQPGIQLRPNLVPGSRFCPTSISTEKLTTEPPT
jgi:cytochrome c oxidase subunit 2